MTIDWWTLGLQTVNVLVLVWLLQHFFWRPLAGMIEQRRAATQAMLADAEDKRGAATAALAAIVTTRAGFAKERDALLAAAQATTEQAHTAQLAQTAKDVAALEATAHAAIVKDTEAAQAAWAKRSGDLAVAIAKRLAARLEGPAVRAAFLDWLLKEVRTLPADRLNTATTNGFALDAVSAVPLEAAEQERYRGLIAEAFGSHPQIAFKVDDGLIAGLELHGPHFAVSNSWRADLTQILAGISHDSRH